MIYLPIREGNFIEERGKKLLLVFMELNNSVVDELKF
jgi:hypothetical protein